MWEVVKRHHLMPFATECLLCAIADKAREISVKFCWCFAEWRMTCIVDNVGFTFPQIAEFHFRHEIEFNKKARHGH